MNQFTIYDQATGRPVKRGVGIDIPPGCIAIDGLHDLRRTALQIVSDDHGEPLYTVVPVLPPRPADTDIMTWEWSESADAWISVLTLSGHKLARWERVKAWRDDAESAPLTVGGHVYDTDQDSQRRLAGAVQLAVLAPPGWTVDWTLADNTVVTLTAADIIAVGIALGAQVSAAHATARALRTQIETALTVTAVNAITWPAP